MKRSKPETSVQAAIVEALRKAGYVVHRLHCGRVRARGGWMRFEEEGTPDLIVAFLGARFVYLETKTKAGELSHEQKKMHAFLRGRRSAVHVVRSAAEALEVVRG